jgi:hypothetical protein
MRVLSELQQLELQIRFFTQNISGTRGMAGIGFVSLRSWERQSNQILTSHYRIAVIEITTTLLLLGGRIHV